MRPRAALPILSLLLLVTSSISGILCADADNSANAAPSFPAPISMPTLTSIPAVPSTLTPPPITTASVDPSVASATATVATAVAPAASQSNDYRAAPSIDTPDEHDKLNHDGSHGLISLSATRSVNVKSDLVHAQFEIHAVRYVPGWVPKDEKEKYEEERKKEKEEMKKYYEEEKDRRKKYMYAYAASTSNTSTPVDESDSNSSPSGPAAGLSRLTRDIRAATADMTQNVSAEVGSAASNLTDSASDSFTAWIQSLNEKLNSWVAGDADMTDALAQVWDQLNLPKEDRIKLGIKKQNETEAEQNEDTKTDEPAKSTAEDSPTEATKQSIQDGIVEAASLPVIVSNASNEVSASDNVHYSTPTSSYVMYDPDGNAASSSSFAPPRPYPYYDSEHRSYASAPSYSYSYDDGTSYGMEPHEKKKPSHRSRPVSSDLHAILADLQTFMTYRKQRLTQYLNSFNKKQERRKERKEKEKKRPEKHEQEKHDNKDKKENKQHPPSPPSLPPQPGYAPSNAPAPSPSYSGIFFASTPVSEEDQLQHQSNGTSSVDAVQTQGYDHQPHDHEHKRKYKHDDDEVVRHIRDDGLIITAKYDYGCYDPVSGVYDSNRCNYRDPIFIGYEAKWSVSADIRTEAGEASIQGALKHGADSVTSVRNMASEKKLVKAELEAIKLATKDVKEKAEGVANAIADLDLNDNKKHDHEDDDGGRSSLQLVSIRCDEVSGGGSYPHPPVPYMNKFASMERDSSSGSSSSAPMLSSSDIEVKVECKLVAKIVKEKQHKP